MSFGPACSWKYSLPWQTVARSAVPYRINNGRVICENDAWSRSSARTRAATVAGRWFLPLVSGSASGMARICGSRVKSFIFWVSTPSLEAMWLRPLIAVRTRPGAGTWKTKLSQINPVDLVLVIEGIGAGHHAPGAVAQKEDQKPRMPLLGDGDQPAQVGDIFGDIHDMETLALGLATAAQVKGENGKSPRRELLGRPGMLPAMRGSRRGRWQGRRAGCPPGSRTACGCGRRPCW